MSRAQQSSIRSFFQPRSQPTYAAPPSSAPPQTANNDKDATVPTPPPAPVPAAPQPVASNPVTINITFPPNGIPVLPSPPSLPSGATIVPLAEQHIPALRRINSLLLPVAYPDSFYAKALDPLVSGLFSRAILWQDSDNDAPKVIGGLICRLEPNPFLDAQGQPLLQPPPPPQQSKPADVVPPNTPYFAIYIQSLVLLSPYRSLGLAAAALEHIIASAALFPAAGSSIDARTIYAHVWTENEEGLKWYEARGFTREGREPVKGYYFKLRPDTAWVVHRHIGPSSAPSILPLALPDATTPSMSTTAVAPPNPTNGTGAVLTAAINLPPITSPTPPQTTGPPRARSRPPPPTASSSSTSLSFQNSRPETEWNDLPPDMVAPTTRSSSASTSTPNSQVQQQQQLLPPPPNGHASMPGSGASSRSSSTTGRKKRERTYPSAAFGK